MTNANIALAYALLQGFKKVGGNIGNTPTLRIATSSRPITRTLRMKP